MLGVGLALAAIHKRGFRDRPEPRVGFRSFRQRRVALRVFSDVSGWMRPSRNSDVFLPPE